MTTIRVDCENNGDAFWDAVMEMDASAVPPEVRVLTSGRNSVFGVSPERAQAVREWCEGVPGWADPSAPQYARHPLLFVD